MSEIERKLYVVSAKPIFIPNVGMRRYGEHFLLPLSQWEQFKELEGFSVRRPTSPQSQPDAITEDLKEE